MHYRKTIRDAINAKLTGAVTYDSSVVPVFQSRVVPFWEVELPCISFYTHNDKTDNNATAPRIYDHVYRVVVEVIAQEKSNVISDDLLDDITDQIEQIFEQDIFINDTVDDIYLDDTTTAMKENGDKIYIAAIMIFNIEYKTRAPKTVPVGALEDFESSDIGISVDGTSVEAVGAQITLP